MAVFTAASVAVLTFLAALFAVVAMVLALSDFATFAAALFIVVTNEDGATFGVALAAALGAALDTFFMLFGKKLEVSPPTLRVILLDGTNDDTEHYFLLSFGVALGNRLDTVFHRTVSSTHVNIVALLRRGADTSCVRRKG
jgi:hypothetical protein